MKMPIRGEKGFTLIELLIVVAILGVLAAIVIPNVGRFIGRGEDEAKDTEFQTVQSAVHSMMVDNEIQTVAAIYAANNATNNMAAFPNTAYKLFGHTINAQVVNYVATNATSYLYWCDDIGTVHQEAKAP